MVLPSISLEDPRIKPVKSVDRREKYTIVVESWDVPDNWSISRDRDMHRRTGVIGGCELGVLRREFWNVEDLEGCYYQRDEERSGYQQSDACEGSHKVSPCRSSALVCARMSISGQGGDHVLDRAPLTGTWPSGVTSLIL